MTVAERDLRRSRRYLKRVLAVITIIVVAITAGSLTRTLSAPGNDALGTRFVEWVRDHGGNGTVNRIENWWYTWHQPPTGGHPKGNRLPTVRPTPPVAPRGAPGGVPTNLVPFATPPLPDEGVWQPTGKLVRGSPAVYVTYLRPDPVHTSLVTAAMWMNMSRLRGALFNGLYVPGPGPWQHGPKVEPRDYASLVAAFNGGFKLDASRGGYYTEGRTVRPLVDGRATLLIRTDGTVAVGMWGRDFHMGPDIASARQNLDLLVDNGQPASGLGVNDTLRLGATVGNRLYVWRSGACTDRTGNLVYFAGSGLTVASLANIEVAAHCVRGMELDINTDWVSGYTYTDTETTPAVQGHKLLGDMVRPDDRYLVDGTRDFIALLAR